MTKEFVTLQFDLRQCHKEALELRNLLNTTKELEERKNVLPFFQARKHLSAFLGSYHPEIVRYDLLAHEFPLFGDFTCDLVVGDSKNHAYAFIEFENAAAESIFVRRGTKATPEWSPRFEHGFSQLVDWFFKLHSFSNTIDFEDKFGSRTIKHLGLLIIGRKEDLGTRESDRLSWRQEYVLLNSKQIHCITFDQLCDDILDRLEQFIRAEEAEEKITADKRASAESPKLDKS